MTTVAQPVVAWRGASGADAPLVVLLHGRESNENDIIALADHLPSGPAYAAVRAPIAAGGGYAWGHGITPAVLDALQRWIHDII